MLAPERRRALLAWGGIVIEDDYDSEYRYDRAPVGTLQRLAPDRVVYLGTASKTLAPALRLGWLLAPPRARRRDRARALGRRLRRRRRSPPAPTRDLLATGEVDRHLRRTRREYRERRDRLVAALEQRLPTAAWPASPPACTCCCGCRRGPTRTRWWPRSPSGGSGSAASRGYRLTPRADEPALVLGYGRIPLAAIDGAVDGAPARRSLMTRVTLATVAEALGVSTMTVSNAYNRPEKLSRELRERILAKADELGYAGRTRSRARCGAGRPACSASCSARRSSYAFEDPATVEFLRGLAGAGIPLHLVPATGGEGDAALVLDAAVDAFILYALPDGHPLVDAVVRGAGCRSSSRAGRSSRAIRSWRSTSAPRRAAAAEHLRALGHQRLAVLSLPFARSPTAPTGRCAPASRRTASRAGGWRATASPSAARSRSTTARTARPRRARCSTARSRRPACCA